MSTADNRLETDDDTDPFEPIREHEDDVEAIADRDDRLGATARVALALMRDEDPSFEDLEEMGVPIGPSSAFTTETEQSTEADRDV